MTLNSFDLVPRTEPLVLAWPTAGNAAAMLAFDTGDAWRAFIGSLCINPVIPDMVTARFARAQKLYLLGWVDFGLIKVGELAAIVALELALTDRFGAVVRELKRQRKQAKKPSPSETQTPQKPRKEQNPTLSELLRHLVEEEGLTDADIPMVVRCGGTAIGQLRGDVRPTLSDRRNKLAHGDPFDGLPTAGLLELVRDLIDFAYRHYIAEAAALGRCDRRPDRWDAFA